MQLRMKISHWNALFDFTNSVNEASDDDKNLNSTECDSDLNNFRFCFKQEVEFFQIPMMNKIGKDKIPWKKMILVLEYCHFIIIRFEKLREI